MTANAIGSPADPAADSITADQTVISLLKALYGGATGGGLSIYRNINLGTTGQVVKAAAGQLYGCYLFNQATTTRYVKVYNKASAPSHADTPVATLPLAAGASVNLAAALGIAFSAGISLRASTGVADNDTGAPSANEVVVAVWYK